MAWTSLSFRVAGKAAEEWSDALLEAGALSVDVVDADAGSPDEKPQFGEPGEFEPGVWAENVLSALFESGADVPAIVAGIAADRNWTIPVVYTLDRVEEQDWVRLTQSQFAPIRISERLWIVPSWERAPNPAAISIVVDPGLAFGTGSHPTTRLCQRWLERHLRFGDAVLDYGCGSGILGIAARRLGAGAVVGTDIDPQALVAATANAAANGVDCAFVPPDRLPEDTFDIVVANILTNPLRALAPLLADRTREGGRIVLSGILVDQASDIRASYERWFKLGEWETEEGWVALSGMRGPR
jgi:ribosomal protein L11 methyltransferase